MVWRRSAVKIYRGLLSIYPAEFRNEYGAEMTRTFEERLASESKILVWLETLADIAFTAPKEHLHILAADVRYGARVLAGAPGFTLMAVLAMALGIGATTAVFSIVNAVLLRSLPYGDPSRLVYVWTPNPRFEGLPREMTPNNSDFNDWVRMSHSFSALATFGQQPFRFGRARVGGALVSADFFRTLDVRPKFGRTIDGHDIVAGRNHVVVISDALWTSVFGRDPAVLGKTLRLNEADYAVIGVMPAQFGYPHREGDFPDANREIERTDVWVPLVFDPHMGETGDARFEGNGVVVARLRAGVSLGQAQTEMSAIQARLDPLYPAPMRGWQAYVQPFLESGIGGVRSMLWLLLGAVGFVLLIACSNVANLLVARATGRRREMGVRAALGAERARLIRQLLTEALMLAALGGAIGLLLAYAAVRLLVWLNPGDIPLLANTSLDSRVLLFACAASLVTGVLFGLLPAVGASRANLVEVLGRGGSRGFTGGSSRGRNALLATEVSLAIVLLAGAGLLIRSYDKLLAVDLGFVPSTLTMQVRLEHPPQAPAQLVSLYRTLLDHVSHTPGVQAAGLVNVLPLSGEGSLTLINVRGYSSRKSEAVFSRAISLEYLNALKIALVRGRAFDSGDENPKRPPVLIVNRAFVKHYFAGQDALGKQVQLGDDKAPWSTVVGVVADTRDASLQEAPHPTIYSPFFQVWATPGNNIDLAVRSTSAKAQMTAAVRDVVLSLDPTATLTNISTMNERIDRARARPRFETVVLTLFAGIAVFLALVGLYGLIAYTVRQRTAEIGIRMALGASRMQILTAVTREGLMAVSVGIAIGLVGAFALTRAIASWLYGVSPTDPMTFVAAPLVILAVAALACLVAAWKATRIDPATALRYE